MLDHIINKHVDPSLFAPLTGRVIAVKCTDFINKTFYCCFEDKLHIVDGISQKVDVTITSTASGFTKYILLNDRSEVNINGNIFVAQDLQILLSKIDIDWEEELSKYTGDVFAHQLMRLIKPLQDHDLQQMITEYLQEEIKLLPTICEVDGFLQQVDTLRNDVDRLDARIKKYAQTC